MLSDYLGNSDKLKKSTIVSVVGDDDSLRVSRPSIPELHHDGHPAPTLTEDRLLPG